MFARSSIAANNQAKDVSLFDNSFSNNLSSSDDILLAVRKSSMIRDKERSHKFINRQKLLFEQSSQRKSSEFERVKEIFNIDSIDIPKQTMQQVNQVNQMNQMEQSIRRPRDRSSGRERERRKRKDYRDARKDTRRDALDDATDVHMKDVFRNSF